MTLDRWWELRDGANLVAYVPGVRSADQPHVRMLVPVKSGTGRSSASAAVSA
jgi:hypothetical protein